MWNEQRVQSDPATKAWAQRAAAIPNTPLTQLLIMAPKAALSAQTLGILRRKPKLTVGNIAKTQKTPQEEFENESRIIRNKLSSRIPNFVQNISHLGAFGWCS
jgi:hypothetical protein